MPLLPLRPRLRQKTRSVSTSQESVITPALEAEEPGRMDVNQTLQLLLAHQLTELQKTKATTKVYCTLIPLPGANSGCTSRTASHRG